MTPIEHSAIPPAGLAAGRSIRFVMYPAPSPSEVAALATTLAAYLTKDTARRWSAVGAASNDTGDHAVYVSLADTVPAWAPGAVRALLPGLHACTSPAYILLGHPAASWIWCVGRTTHGLSNAVYALLHELGHRWLLPHSAWHLAPVGLAEVRTASPGLVEPALTTFTFVGQGRSTRQTLLNNAALPTAGGDEDAWGAWVTANRFPSSKTVPGHVYQVFLSSVFRADPDADPLIQASVGGVRPYGRASNRKLHYTHTGTYYDDGGGAYALAHADRNGVEYFEDRSDYVGREGLVSAFGAWVVAQIAGTLGAPGPTDNAHRLEPSDGTNHCDCPKCLGLLRGLQLSQADSSISDRVFHLTNRIAEVVDAALPGDHVSLLAYREHAPVPTVSIRPNVHVWVAAGAYHWRYTGLTTEELLAAWSQKSRQDGFTVAVREYLSLPEGNLGGLQHAVSDLDAWRAAWDLQRYRDIALESSWGAGAVGPLLWAGAADAWTVHPDGATRLTEFVRAAFGDLAGTLLPLYRRLYLERFLLSALGLGMCIDEIRQVAPLLAGDVERGPRLDHLKAWILFLALRLETLQTPLDEDPALPSLDALLVWIWRLDPWWIAPSSALTDYVRAAVIPPPPRKLSRSQHIFRQKWDPLDPNSSAWRRAYPPPSTDHLDLRLAQAAARHPSYPHSRVPLRRPSGVIGVGPPSDPAKRFELGGPHTLLLRSSPGAGVDLRVVFVTRRVPTAARIRLIDNAGVVHTRTLPVQAAQSVVTLRLSFPGVSAGDHTLEVDAIDSANGIAFPAQARGLALAVTGSVLTSGNPDGYLWFWAPPGGTYLEGHFGAPPAFVDAAGRAVPSVRLDATLYQLRTAAGGFFGARFQAVGTHGARIVNTPELWSTDPAAVLDPR